MAPTKIAVLSHPGLTSKSYMPIHNFQHLASYNLIRGSTPAIAVPGSPNLWSPPSSGTYSSSPSHYERPVQAPKYPLEPLFRALLIEEPRFRLDSIDIVSDRDSLWQLLSFVNPSHGHVAAFRIEAEVVGGTVIFCRTDGGQSKDVSTNAQLDEYEEIERQFEKTLTTPHVESSASHHRVISYELGEIRFMVCYEAKVFVERPQPVRRNNGIPDTPESLPPPKTAYPASPTSDLMVIKEGHEVLPGKIGGVKVAAADGLGRINHTLSQMWLSRTVVFVSAVHKYGQLIRPLVASAYDEVMNWEKQYQTDIRNLVQILGNIISLMKSRSKRTVIEYDPDPGKLVVWSGEEATRMLPDDLYVRLKHPERERRRSTKRAGLESTARAGLVGAERIGLEIERPKSPVPWNYPERL
ncbi:uncharacterized protein BDV14DRAFT_194727 [Aspergillus stella-maris]|uniref:uncharacterized protein n=1 Tax=Aspergillus stella-maris TaxID=1810926 RepID=UPI003CCE46FE